jgi:hypothetical protein
MSLIIIICGIIALILIFISFTWNPEQNEDGVELNIGKPIDETEKIEKIWESPIQESPKHEVVELEIVETHTQNDLPEIIDSIPVLPYPSAEDLGIRRKSKLENVYNHLIKYGKLTPKSYNKLDIVRGNTYIFKLRQKGIKIETIRDKKGNFIKYILK